MAAAAAHRPYVYDRAPVMLYWEVTRACDLACLHCRAEAIPGRDSRELTTDEAAAFLRGLLEFGEPTPHVVITGGDPLKRPDLLELVQEGVRLGVPISLAPSATPLLDLSMLARLRRAGLAGFSLSLDGSDAGRHDRLRGVPGCFDRTMHLAHGAGHLGLPLQINTLVCAETLADLPALYQLVRGLPLRRWSLFFLIAVGRGRVLRSIGPGEAERLCHWVSARSRESAFAIAATEAPFYRRVAVESMRRAGMPERAIGGTPVARAFGIRDGNGVLFVSHTGAVYPSGFLPVHAGNVRRSSVVMLYRTSPVFQTIRDVGRLQGKCGRCAFADVCGGSRARAFAHTGRYMASDPLCAYQPDAHATAPRESNAPIAHSTS
jgi:radical SAM protein